MKYPPGHLAIRNLTRQTLTLRCVEHFDVTRLSSSDRIGVKVESLRSNFTSLLKDSGSKDDQDVPAKRKRSLYSKILKDAEAVKKDDLDLTLKPFKAQLTAIQVGATGRKNLKVHRLAFESEDGSEYRLDVPGASGESQTLKPVKTGRSNREYTAIYNPDTGALALFDTSHLSRWMEEMPDHLPLSALSIPGTHNSPTCYNALPSVRCQAVSPAEQLQNGVRFLDVRVQVEDPEKSSSDVLHLVHSVFPASLSGSKHLRDLLNDLYNFLDNNPSEPIILCLKREGRGNGTDAQLADRLFDHYIKPKYWYMRPGIPRLGQARGKIVLMRRFRLSDRLQKDFHGKGFGIDATNWGDNAANHEGGDVHIQDFYEVTDTENIDKKIRLVCEHFDRAGAVSTATNGIVDDGKPPARPLFINFLSGSHFWSKKCWPEKIAARLNPVITAFLCEQHDVKDESKGDGCTGIVVCDWVGKDGDWDLIRAVVGMNSRILTKEGSRRDGELVLDHSTETIDG